MTRRIFRLQGADGASQMLELKGREEWALSNLLAAGDRGCTPIDTPGPRWSDYVFKLRRRGIDVATITEAHDGPYAGHHARYRLVSKVESVPNSFSRSNAPVRENETPLPAAPSSGATEIGHG